MASSRAIACWAFGLLCTGAIRPSPIEASQRPPAQEKLLDDCRATLRRVVAVMQNVDIEFTVKVDWQIPNLPRMTGESSHIYLNDGRLYFRFKRTFPPLPGRPHVEELEEIAYDKNTYYLGKNTAGGSPSVKTMLGDNPDSAQAWQNYTRTCLYFEVAGFRLPRKVAQMKGGCLTSFVLDCLDGGEINRVAMDEAKSLLTLDVTIPDPVVTDSKTTDLDLLAEEMKQNAAKPAEIEARIGVLRKLRASGRKRRIDLLLDVSKDYSLVSRVESTLDGKVIYEVKASDFRRHGEAGVWLPDNGSIKTFVRDTELAEGFQSDPNRTDVVHLERVGFQPRSDISFVLDYGPGAMIVDRSSKEAKASPAGEVKYVQPASPDQLRRAAEAGRPRRRFLIFNIALLALIILSSLVWRYRSKKRADEGK